jgi:predicted  nucleic acid-binding Zn-ribbon protein|tara:strand:- start:43 stop:1221 length:1179 start_codon:yes stop_codon:yes gene_type:complete
LDKIIKQDHEEFKVGCKSPYNHKHTYLGFNEGYSSYKRFFLQCSECAKDPEQYGEGIFKVTIRTLRKGDSCYCSPKGLKPNKSHYDIRIKRLCQEYGYTFNGYMTEDVKSNTKINITCNKGHTYDSTSVSKFLSTGRKCPKCAGNYKRNYNEDKVLKKIVNARGDKYTYKGLDKVTNNRDKFTAICPVHGSWQTDLYHHTVRKQDCPHEDCCFTKISEVKASNTEDFVSKCKIVHGDRYDYTETIYDRVFKDVTIRCLNCNKYFTQKASDHLSGCGCNLCRCDKQRQIYIFVIKDGNTPIAIKTGRAVDYKTRLNRQSSNSIYEVEVLSVWVTKDYDSCKKIEGYINTSFKGKYLSVEEYKDGYSETRSLTYIDEICNYLDNNCKRLPKDEL